MVSFREVMEFTRKWSSHAAFEDACCRLMYDTLLCLPDRTTVLEIGVEYGRSTSVILQVAREKRMNVILVDPFVDPLSYPKFLEMAAASGCGYKLMHMTTRDWIMNGAHVPPLDLVHIDGSHTADDLTFDCVSLLPYVIRGGYACFHDYGEIAVPSLPDVTPTVNHFMAPIAWEPIATAHTLGVWRRR